MPEKNARKARSGFPMHSTATVSTKHRPRRKLSTVRGRIVTTRTERAICRDSYGSRSTAERRFCPPFAGFGVHGPDSGEDITGFMTSMPLLVTTNAAVPQIGAGLLSVFQGNTSRTLNIRIGKKCGFQSPSQNPAPSSLCPLRQCLETFRSTSL